MIGIPTPTVSPSQITELTWTVLAGAADELDGAAADELGEADSELLDDVGVPDEDAESEPDPESVPGLVPRFDPVEQPLSAIPTMATNPAAPRPRRRLMRRRLMRHRFTRGIFTRGKFTARR
jgi:hypothetical protein